jgi:hypothetical protein
MHEYIYIYCEFIVSFLVQNVRFASARKCGKHILQDIRHLPFPSTPSPPPFPDRAICVLIRVDAFCFQSALHDQVLSEGIR